MAPNSGTRIGPYEITAPIGAGGMGEVCRGTDAKLRREVAIEVLPPELAPEGGLPLEAILEIARPRTDAVSSAHAKRAKS